MVFHRRRRIPGNGIDIPYDRETRIELSGGTEKQSETKKRKQCTSDTDNPAGKFVRKFNVNFFLLQHAI